MSSKKRKNNTMPNEIISSEPAEKKVIVLVLISSKIAQFDVFIIYCVESILVYYLH